MVLTVGIIRAITNLNEVHTKFNLSVTDNPQFFQEWWENLPALTQQEKETLDKLKNRYFYYAAAGAITEGTVNMIMLSPLIELIGLCDYPFQIMAEKYVQIKLENQGRVLVARLLGKKFKCVTA